MSLDYESLFSKIDKAKKKRWTQADTDKWAKQQKEEKKEKKPRVSQPKYRDGKESKTRGRTFGSLGEYSSGGVAGQEKQRYHSTSKKPIKDKRIKPADEAYTERKETKEKDPGSVRIGDLDESGKPIGKEPRYSKQEERSGMTGKPHKDRKKPDTTERLDIDQKKLDERKTRLQDLKDLKDELERKQSGVAGETKEEGKKKDEDWDESKLLAAREQTNPRTPHPKKRRTPNYGKYSGEEKLGEEPSGMFGSKGHPRKKPKKETEARYKKIRAKIEEMEKDPYTKPVSEASGKKIGIDAKERTDEKEIKVDPRMNEPTPKKDFVGPTLTMSEEEKERERKKFPQSGLAYTETTQYRIPSSASEILDRKRMAEQKERNRKIQQGITGHGTKKDPFIAPAAEQLGSKVVNVQEQTRPFKKPQSKRVTDPTDYFEVSETTTRGTTAEKPKTGKQRQRKVTPKKPKKAPKYDMDDEGKLIPYKPKEDKDVDEDLDTEYDGTVGKAWKSWLKEKDALTGKQSRAGKPKKEEEIDDIMEETKRYSQLNMYKSWLERKETKSITTKI